MKYNCPYCGHATKAVTSVKALTQMRFGRVSGRIVRILVDQFEQGKAIYIDRLVEMTYQGDIDGGPLAARNTMYVHLCRIRQRLETEAGWTVLGSGSGSREGKYNLMPIKDKPK